MPVKEKPANGLGLTSVLVSSDVGFVATVVVTGAEKPPKRDGVVFGAEKAVVPKSGAGAAAETTGSTCVSACPFG